MHPTNFGPTVKPDLASTRRQSTALADPPDLDRLPPHDSEAEAGALACVLTATNGEAESYLDGLCLEHFYELRNQTIFRALRCLRIDGKPLHSVALAQWLRDKHQIEDAGGLDYISALPDKTPSPANFPAFLDAIEAYRVRRVAIRDAAEVQKLAFDTSVAPDALADANRRMLESHSRQGANASPLTIRTPDELLAMKFDDSDRILGDYLLAVGQSLVIVGAGGLGKSRLAEQLPVAAITGRPFVGFETRRPDLRWLILQAENSNRRLQADLASLKAWTGADDWTRANQQLSIHTLEADADGFLSLGDPSAQRRIADTIAANKSDVVCFDSLYNFAIGDLSKDEDMGATLLAISRLAKAGDPRRAIVVLHHALTGRAGAARATGYDRASFGRNSKVLHSWTRAQLNVAPGSPDSNDTLVLSCGKCSNGKEFAPFAVRLNPDTMIYELAPDFDMGAWQSDVTGKHANSAIITPERVRELCKGSLPKKHLARAIMDDTGCDRSYAYRMIDKAEHARLIHYTKATDRYVAKS
jgi:hypothetical protein